MFYDKRFLLKLCCVVYARNESGITERELNAMYAAFIDVIRTYKNSANVIDFVRERLMDNKTYASIAAKYNCPVSTCTKAIDGFVKRLRSPMRASWFANGLGDYDTIYFKKYYDLAKALGFNVFYGDSRDERYRGSVEYLSSDKCVINALWRRDIRSIGELVRLRDDLDGHFEMKIRNIGKKKSIELNEALLDYA
ncbi:MAG: hypothetical protein IJE43_02050 [Alphaproteobacteria bacterium]|nr:hypothetical protein [Alphaproteobacteria bacterium]